MCFGSNGVDTELLNDVGVSKVGQILYEASALFNTPLIITDGFFEILEC